MKSGNLDRGSKLVQEGRPITTKIRKLEKQHASKFYRLCTPMNADEEKNYAIDHVIFKTDRRKKNTQLLH